MDIRTNNVPVESIESSSMESSATEVQGLALRLLRPLLGEEQFAANASSFLTALAVEFGCVRACLGVIEGRVLKICAISNHPHAIKQTVLPDVASAMEEAVMQQTSVLYPAPKETFSHIVVAHAELARRRNVLGLVTVPLARNGRVIGAVTLESRNRHLNAKDVLALEHVLSDLGRLLEFQWLQDQPLKRRATSAARSGLKRWNQRYPTRLKLIAGSVATVVALLLFALPIPSSITAPARLETSVQRVITVPVDGFLKQVHVRPGDIIKAGQPLAELEDEALRLNRRKLESEVSQRENGLADAMVRNDRVQIGVSQAKLEETLAQLELVDQDLARARLEAPFDGVVIQGDLKQMLGAPLRRGDSLLTLSQGEGFRVIVNVDERDMTDLKLNQSGKLTLAAFPNERIPVRITRIMPVAVAADGVNGFELEAEITGHANGRLTPGLKGVMKIDEGAQPLGLKWAQRIYRRLSFLAWSWLG